MKHVTALPLDKEDWSGHWTLRNGMRCHVIGSSVLGHYKSRQLFTNSDKQDEPVSLWWLNGNATAGTEYDLMKRTSPLQAPAPKEAFPEVPVDLGVYLLLQAAHP